ncbi:MAG: glycosyl hydrolase family protein [Solirubrobacteraceae bacterium]
MIRFGGDTTDWTWWPTRGIVKPGGIRYTLDRRWVEVARATARALDARLILGINFEADRRAIAATEATSLLNGIGHRYIAGFEPGNEPEVYGTLGWYTTPAGVSVPGRPASYRFDSYLRDYASVIAALPRDVPLVGPASGSPVWLAGLGRYLTDNPRVRLVSFHRYPLHRCFTPRDAPTYPTISNLLSPLASSGLATSLRSAVAVATARGVPFRADELNSVSCGGAHGVSDTFASALWILDTLFNMDRVGVDGVNIHTFQSATYEPFAFSRSGGQWRAQVKPMYYGLLMFARAAPPGSRLLPTSFSGGANMLRSWATRGLDGQIRIVLINDSRQNAVTVAVRAPGSARAAIVQRLRAPGIRATRGVTLNGQTFGQTTTTGALDGRTHSVVLASVRDRYVVRLASASAVLLTLS